MTRTPITIAFGEHVIEVAAGTPWSQVKEIMESYDSGIFEFNPKKPPLPPNVFVRAEVTEDGPVAP